LRWRLAVPVGLLGQALTANTSRRPRAASPAIAISATWHGIVVRWAEQVRPDVILMENVEEFRGWGPIGNEGQPIKELEGQTFELWVKALRKAGYKVQWREASVPADYGAPTIRKRFFMIARRDGRTDRLAQAHAWGTG